MDGLIDGHPIKNCVGSAFGFKVLVEKRLVFVPNLTLIFSVLGRRKKVNNIYQ